MYQIPQFLMQKIVPLAEEEVQFYHFELHLTKFVVKCAKRLFSGGFPY